MSIPDKHRPVRATPSTTTAPWGAIASLWIFAGLASLWSASDLQRWATFDGTPAARQVANGLAALADTTGVAAARDRVDRAFSGLHDGPRVLRRRSAPPEPPEPEAPEPAETRARATAPVVDPPAPRRVLLVGASSINHHLGVELERCLEGFTDVDVTRLGKIGTGLARPDVWDWQEQIAKLQAESHPDLVIAQLGGNDCQKIVLPSGRDLYFGKPAWKEEYGRRLGAILSDVHAGGARAVVLGMPTVQNPVSSRCYEIINDATSSAVVGSGASYLDTSDLTTGADGQTLRSLKAGGRLEPMWMDDGVHLTRPGAISVSERLCARLERSLSLIPRDASLARYHPFILDSAARGRATRWVAVVPREIPGEGLPVLLLLHGAWGSVEDWPEHAHVELQRLATAHRVVLVLPDGDPHGWYVDSELVPGARIETFLIDELLPELDLRLPSNGRLGVAGLSMGGHGAISLSLRNPGVFATASSMSGVLDLSQATSREALVERLGPYGPSWDAWSARHLAAATAEISLPMRISVGTEDRWLEVNRAFHGDLQARGVPHVYEESPGGHDWAWWAGELPRHVAWHAEILHGVER